MKSKIGKIIAPALALMLVLGVALVLYLVRPVKAVPVGIENTKLGAFTGPEAGIAQDDNVKASLDIAHTELSAILSVGLGIGRGSTWYVDSGVADTEGTSWATAVGTVEAAVALASADDTILVAQGHNEALGAAGLDLDKTGLQVIGFGVGQYKPTFDFDTSSSTAGCSIGAPSILIKNLRFRVSANKVSTGLDIEATGDDAQIIDCDFGFAETTVTDEFSVGINVTSAAHNVRIAGLYMDAQRGEAIAGIYVGTVSGFVLEPSATRKTRITGDYSTAALNNVGASDDIFVDRCLIMNGTLGGDGEIGAVAAVSMANDTGGIFSDNRIISDVGTALLMRIGDDMIFMRNVVTDTDGDEFSGSLEHGTTTPLNSVSAHSDG